jgi:hypothetical protein
MNERINGLWWQARIGYNNQNCDPEVVAKFAELIVRECVGIADEYDGVGSTIVSRIEKHFGVEE